MTRCPNRPAAPVTTKTLIREKPAVQEHVSWPYDAIVSDENPPPNPFGDLPFFGDIAKMFGGGSTAGPWETARQLAVQLANEGRAEDNVDPVQRVAVEQLVRVAELRIADLTGLSLGGQTGLTTEATNRGGWATRTIRDYQPLLQGLADSLSKAPLGEPDPSDPMAPMMSALMGMLGPMMLGFTAGSMVGHLAQGALGGYALPIPRPEDSAILLSLPTIDSIAEDWSLDLNDTRMWTCIHEVAHHAIFSVPHIRERINSLLHRYVAAFEVDPTMLGEQFGSLDLSNPAGLAELQSSLGDPHTLLQALQSPAQVALQPELAALTSVVVGYADHLVDRIASDLIGSHAQITEAIHRQRVTTSQSDRFVEKLLGLELDQAQYDRGAAFIEGIIERAGHQGLQRIFASPENLPTVNEVDAPGLWLARIDLRLDEDS